MAINRESIDLWEEYVPDVEGERELFIDEPDKAVTVEIRLVSRDELQQYVRRAERMKKTGRVTDSDERSAKDLFARHVRNVKNVTIDGKKITTGEELYDTNEMGLINDISSAFVVRSKLDAGLAKKLKRRSGSPSLRRQNNGDGDAQNATQQSTQTTKEIQEKTIQNSESQMKSNESRGTVTELQIRDCSSDGIPRDAVARKQS